jgi:sterol desaturase/sphingolipid hydroxylase (fatty acid hydroxylase superfamily)
MIRLAIFLGLLVTMSALEVLAPRRPLSESRARRWSINLGITAINTVILRLTLGAAAYRVALVGEEKGWGALSLVEQPAWFEFVLALVILDFALYIQHVLSHALPILWRLHRVHHSDVNLDATSGSRFHPLEILYSMLYKAAVVLALGASPMAVVVFEIILNGCAVFNHANLKIPDVVERWLRLVIVTPDYHRLHHSVIRAETNSNFGFSIPIWDRLCGTYRPQPARGHEEMEIGILEYREPIGLSLGRLLAMPLEREIGEYSLQGSSQSAEGSSQSAEGSSQSTEGSSRAGR